MLDAATVRTVAIFNSSDDTVEMLALLMTDRGFRPVSGHVDQIKSGESDFLEFVEKHKPTAIIWDVTPPYDRNWTFYKLIRALRPLEHTAFVLTTTHKPNLDALAGQQTGALEIMGKPYDLNLVAEAVLRAIDERGRTRLAVARA